MMLAMKSLLTLALVSSLAAAQYVEPDWWERISSEDTTGRLKRCWKKTAAGVLPADGVQCARTPKICYFGTQECGELSAHPTTKCSCDTKWDCEPEACPVNIGGCASQADCAGFEFCFAEDDNFCGICQNIPSCSSDLDCFGSLLCDDRKAKCLCNGSGPVCNPACTSDTDCGLGDTCSLPDGHCVATACTVDVDCVDHFACSATGGTSCERRTCTADPDCSDGGFCVKGKCYVDRGFCSPPPP
eukprot:CAMPEP_0119016150 /NCGR_PEP_ID=MMETSP1176-20130426/11842_1 /TAXON_ID=265551 /ORGANISM="Synedropsis recta cf, Strain CCMP1620" /LENGTH=243 /DNA_ID=CAMNT_0006969483 /DNA_START=29 /DNA_END=760 /DNA_ORIENTATION=+